MFQSVGVFAILPQLLASLGALFTAAGVGEYLVVAKRKGNNWFIGGITAEKGYEVEISLDFLDNNRFYQMTMFTDGLNAGLQALDYNKESKTVSRAQALKVKMVRNGGFA